VATDTERLDHLARHYNDITKLGRTYYVREHYGRPMHKMPSLRAAIDYSIKVWITEPELPPIREV